jgi:hypothetical protein
MSTYASYKIFARWGGRPEMPAGLATRFLETIDTLQPLHPLLAQWTWGDYQELDETEGLGGKYPLIEIRTDMTHAVARNLCTNDDGPPDPEDGYGLLAIAENAARPDSHLSFSGSAGRPPEGGGFSMFPWMNSIDLTLGPDPDPSLTTYALWRQALLIVAETWEASWAEAWPADMSNHWSNRTFHAAWMCYLSPRLARHVMPPSGVIVEQRPNGGLFMAATDETFRLDDPQHMAQARMIEATLVPLDRLPFPIDDPYV